MGGDSEIIIVFLAPEQNRNADFALLSNVRANTGILPHLIGGYKLVFSWPAFLTIEWGEVANPWWGSQTDLTIKMPSVVLQTKLLRPKPHL
jgi:hypothetical protein